MTTRQKVELYLRENPAATYRQIMAAVGIKSTSTVAFHINKIKRPSVRERLDAQRELLLRSLRVVEWVSGEGYNLTVIDGEDADGLLIDLCKHLKIEDGDEAAMELKKKKAA